MASKEAYRLLYKEFMRVCDQWPIDASRSGRDFGEYLRHNYRGVYKQEDFNAEDMKKTLDALVKISSNYYYKKYPRVNEINYTGLEVTKCQEALSNDNQVAFQKQRSWWERLISKRSLSEKLELQLKK
uniref:Mitochondrial nucleoid factor 1 n=1 Tax=Hydra vulgaris TaxID=6087 RepID=T2M612_HYDVU